MKKILLLLTFLALAAFAQNYDTIEPEKKLQRPVYNFQTAAFGFSFWSNYHDDEKNPEKDYVTAFPLIRYGRIWEMTTHGAITALTTWHAEFGTDWELQGTMTVGGRFSPLDEVVSPFIGAGIGIGIQIDAFMDDWVGAFGLCLGGEAGLNFFHTSAVQLEVGVGFNILATKVDFGKSFKSWNIFFGVNY